MRNRHRAGLSLATAVLVLLQGTSPALAWGRIGHRASAKLAEARLTKATRDAVRELLEPGESLADLSTWADEHRRERPESGPWHYVNVPIDEPRYDPKYCAEDGCVVAKIDEFRGVLADPCASRAKRREALQFLVHLVEDLHQPLHVGDDRDRGGNDLQLQFLRKGTNLHQLWDSRILERHDIDEDVWVREITEAADADHVERWSKGTVVDWANESLAAAKLAYQPPGSRARLKSGAKLDEAYAEFAEPVIRERLAQAGVRLAAMLNETLGR